MNIKFQPNEFVCKQCREIKKNATHVRRDQKIGEILCSSCKSVNRERILEGKLVEEPVSRDSRSPKAIQSHQRERGSISLQQNQQATWEEFKQATRQSDINIILNSKYYEEADLPQDIHDITLEESDSEIIELTKRLNLLRSHKYHILRKAAYEKQVSLQEAMKEDLARRKAVRHEKNRAEYIKSLPEAQKHYKSHKITPAEGSKIAREVIEGLLAEGFEIKKRSS